MTETMEQQELAPAPATDAFVPQPLPVMAEAGTDAPSEPMGDLSLLRDVEVTTTVELGRTSMPIREVLKLHHGAVIELDKLVGQPADLLINNTLVARGEVIVVNERFGFRVTKFVPRANA